VEREEIKTSKTTRSIAKVRGKFTDGGQAEPVGEKCEKCGSPMAKKFGRFGEFLACTNYPECKSTRKLAKLRDESGEDGPTEATAEICETCGKPMAMRRSRFGQFLACTAYPDCKTIRKIQKGGTSGVSEVVFRELCPQCSEHSLALKQGRYGPFIACSNYPKCKYIKQETTGVSCPECGVGELVVKKSQRGAFYGCGNYPACKFTLRDTPVPRACPECGARFIVEHTRKDGSHELQCRTDSCEFKDALP